MEVVLVALETVTRLLVRAAVYERLYYGVRSGVGEVLVELYREVLVFLAFAREYLEGSSASRLSYRGCFLVCGC